MTTATDNLDIFSDLDNFIEEPTTEESSTSSVMTDAVLPKSAKPHVVFAIPKLKGTLNSIKDCISVKQDTVEKSVLLSVKDNFCVITTPKVNGIRTEIKLEVENEENIYEGKFALEYDALSYLISRSTGYIMLEPEDDDCKVTLQEGEIVLNYLDIDFSLYESIFFSNQTFYEGNDIKTLPAQSFLPSLKTIFASEILALRTEDARVSINTENSLANYLVCAMRFKDLSLEAGLRTFDCKILASFFKDSFEINFKKVDEGYLLFSLNKKILLPETYVDDVKEVQNQFNSFKAEKKLQINYSRLKKVLEIVAKITEPDNAPLFSVNKEGELKVKAKSRSGRSLDLKVGEGYTEELEFTYPVNSFLKILSLNPTENTIVLSISQDNTLLLETTSFDILFFSVLS